jgi:hypothetical protein
MEVLMAEGKKALAEKIVYALLRADPDQLKPEDRARQTRIKTGSEKKNSAIEFYANGSSEEWMQMLLQTYNSKAK